MRKLKTAEIERLTKEEAKRSPGHPVVGILEDIRSIHNVGSIFRTAEAASLTELILTGITGTPEHRMFRKAALGAQDVVKWRHEADTIAAIIHLKQSGWTVAALEITDTPRYVAELRSGDFPLALVVGNEVTGVSDAVLSHCDFAVEIGQYGSKHSLNAAVAFGIAAFGIVERYRYLNEQVVLDSKE
ncbi:MAG: TrmH family RNA methyltransferase [Bacteroidetes bacterium]|nr:TrmH family RNA methyltransferase [Bacteroidota bacterium]